MNQSSSKTPCTNKTIKLILYSDTAIISVCTTVSPFKCNKDPSYLFKYWKIILYTVVLVITKISQRYLLDFSLSIFIALLRLKIANKIHIESYNFVIRHQPVGN